MAVISAYVGPRPRNDLPPDLMQINQTYHTITEDVFIFVLGLLS